MPRRPQDEIVYLCFKVADLTESDLQRCFTDKNAATSITKFNKAAKDLDKLDFRSIYHSIQNALSNDYPVLFVLIKKSFNFESSPSYDIFKLLKDWGYWEEA